jgi:ATP-dependent helicase HrpA
MSDPEPGEAGEQAADDPARPLNLTVPPELPIAEQAEAICAALQRSQVVVVAGETGSGKTTQLPKLCLAAGLGEHGLIGHTQPRRLAARSVAARIAEELGTPLGDYVGYSVRFSDQTGPNTRVKLMTDGLLLAEIQSDRLLSRYEALIIDEAHERSLNIDFLLGYLKTLLRKRPELKVIITSATIDVQAFAAHFDAPVIEVSGRGYPVEVRYREPAADEELADQVLACLEDLAGNPVGGNRARDVLVFLSGEREIFSLARELRGRLDHSWELLPLYARLPAGEQQKVFRPGKSRRVVLCTNVAETSLTVPNIGYVIDVGLARISRYSYRSKLQRLPIEPISQASARQRLGRCGRIAPGRCYRLYSEADFDGRPDYTDPEIKRTNLASVVLQMEVFRLGRIAQFPFLEPPDPAAVRAAVKLLEELRAIDGGRATDLGRAMARLPVDPRLARMLLEGARNGSLRELLIIVSALSVQDPRDRPEGQRSQADARHESFADKQSDFIAWLNLWAFSEQERENLTRRRYERLLRTRFLSVPRMREWRELHRQLRLACQKLRLTMNTEPASYEALHQALLSGSLAFVGRHDEKGRYEGASGLHFRIFPGSALFEARPKWLVAAEIAETQRVYARTVAHIEPRWIEAQAAHLLKRSYSEPHFSARRGETMAYEKVSFRGLMLTERRAVGYGRIDPAVSRALFIQEGLVAGALRQPPEFLEHNLLMLASLMDAEARTRRRDLLVGPELQAAWYEERLPASVLSARTLRRALGKDQALASVLAWTQDDLAAQRLPGLDDFPGALDLDGQQYPLTYRFAPGEPDDGVSVSLPLGKLNALPEAALDWSVPGFFESVCEAWLKSLPKPARRALAPLADRVPEVTAWLLDPRRYRQGQLRGALVAALAALYELRVTPSELSADRLPEHLQPRIVLLDSSGRELAASRSLATLRSDYEAQVSQTLADAGPPAFEQEHLAAFPERERLPHSVTLGVRAPGRTKSRTKSRTMGGKRGGSANAEPPPDAAERVVYPGFVDGGETVALKAFPDARSAAEANRAGLARLALLSQRRAARQIVKTLRGAKALQLHYAVLGSRDDLEQAFLLGCAWHFYFAGQGWIDSAVAFEARLQQAGSLVAYAAERQGRVEAAVQARFEAGRAVEQLQSPAFAAARADVEQQLIALAPPGLLLEASDPELEALPRYFQALIYRMTNLQGRVDRDQQAMATAARFAERLARLCEVPALAAEERAALETGLRELRVALFAEPLRLPKVSEKRLDRALRDSEVRHALV